MDQSDIVYQDYISDAACLGIIVNYIFNLDTVVEIVLLLMSTLPINIYIVKPQLNSCLSQVVQTIVVI